MPFALVAVTRSTSNPTITTRRSGLAAAMASGMDSSR